ncbi:MAG: DegT/DnrJ/EryC1/StrS family aminotransferase [Abditibacteriales bacterium]|nr:DegT/DnrJ/EryC1/StrS family aminotransferase [Abditibacteriales bacterium]MDW8365251.1 DegT/DnrJ/EryC1/StrS family aminotransferase [Abditibacteriales bacterium]
MSEKLALFGGAQALTRVEELTHVSRWPSFAEEEKAAVLEAMDADHLYAVTAQFEEEFAAYHGVRFAVAQNNGTSTLHAAYFAAGVGPGDEVITSAYTWHLQVGPILALHALPVFCDVDPRSAALDPDDVRRKISRRTKAIVVLHPYGGVAPMEDIIAIGREYGLPVIEDCSHAHGATYRGRKVGTLGDIGCFSLQASKLMTAIEGGVLITDNEEFYERVCVLAHYERIPRLRSQQYRRFYEPDKVQAPACFGFKYRMNPLAAALARVQLRHLDEWNAVRRQNMKYLDRRLMEVGRGVFEPPYEAPQTERLWLNYICQYHADKAGVPRERFIAALRAEGLPVSGGRTGYLPVYWNPLYEERCGIWGAGYPFDAPYVTSPVTYQRGMCPQAERFEQRTVGLPVLHRPVSQELREEIVRAVEKVIDNLAEL